MKLVTRRSPDLVGAVDRATVLARLELDVTRRLDGLLQGDFRGGTLGPGSEPAQARAYEPGDDARRIDWSLTARMSALHVRQTDADRELETWLLADRSPSLDFGTALLEKRDLVTAALAAFGLRTARNGNRVGMVITGDTTLITRRAQTTRASVLAGLAIAYATDLRDDAAPRRADLAAGARWLDATVKRRGRIVVVSDFLDSSPWPDALRRLGLRHDIVAVQVVDPRELDLPPVGLLALVDTENGQRLHVQTNSARLRERYRAAAGERHAAIAASLRAAGAAHLVLSTDRDWVIDIAAFLSRRRTPVRGAALQGNP